ncbi:MAG: hypothetical protein R3C68_05685 [Myxococcota bacterium]
MQTTQKVRLIILSSLIFGACDISNSPRHSELRANFQVSLAGTAAQTSDVVFGELLITHGEEVITVALDENLAGSFSVPVGSSINVDAVVLSLNSGGFFEFTGRGAIGDTLPGANILELQATESPTRTGQLIPLFSEGSPLGIDFDVTVTDSLTQVSTTFRTHQSINLPQGRQFTFSGTIPGTTLAFTRQLAEQTPFGDTTLDIGPAPTQPQPTEQPNGPLGVLLTNQQVFTPTGLQGDPNFPGFSLQCAVGSVCANPAAFVPCNGATLDLGSAIDGDYPVSVNYAEAPNICTVISARLDGTGPREYSIHFTPNHLGPNAPEQIDAVIKSNKPLNPASISIENVTDGPSIVNLCTTGTNLGKDVGCPNLDVSSFAGNRIEHLRVRATDLAGNAINFLAAYGNFTEQMPNEPTIVSFEVFPFVGDLAEENVPFRIGVTNPTGAQICSVDIKGVEVVNATTMLPVSMPLFSTAVDTVSPLDAGAMVQLYGILSGANALPAADYIAQIDLNWDNCASSLTTQPTSVPMTLRFRPFRLPSGGLTLSRMTGSAINNPSLELPILEDAASASLFLW